MATEADAVRAAVVEEKLADVEARVAAGVRARAVRGKAALVRAAGVLERVDAARAKAVHVKAALVKGAGAKAASVVAASLPVSQPTLRTKHVSYGVPHSRERSRSH